MPKLELFVSDHCLSLQQAMRLYDALRTQFPGVEFEVVDFLAHKDRAELLGIFIVPTFVMDGRILATGVPAQEKIIKEIRSCITC